MKKILSSFAICFSTYSRIPMPHVSWEASNMGYIFTFFPLVGLAVGAVQLLWLWFAQNFAVNTLLYAVAATVIPILITGGIHLDGYMDTCDALFSYGDREKKLQIMKDPNAGAFAVIYCGVYLLLTVGLFSQLYGTADWKTMVFLGCGYLLSRSISSSFVVRMTCAKNSGLAYLFHNGADRKFSQAALTVWALLLLPALFLLYWQRALLTLVLLAQWIFWFAHMARKQFGGITGDLAGFALEISELLILLATVIL